MCSATFLKGSPNCRNWSWWPPWGGVSWWPAKPVISGLSMEMGALIAGVAISTFPYNLDIIGKIINIRDFFITLFLSPWAWLIPNPMTNLGLVGIALHSGRFPGSYPFSFYFPVLYSGSRTATGSACSPPLISLSSASSPWSSPSSA